MNDSCEVGQGKNDTQQEDLLPHWPAAERIKFQHDCVEIRPCKEADAALQGTGETARGSQLAMMWIYRHLHVVRSSEVVGRVDMVVDMVVMLKTKLSSDHSSHHLLHPNGLIAWSGSLRRAHLPIEQPCRAGTGPGVGPLGDRVFRGILLPLGVSLAGLYRW